jgi:hypothetical protein
LIGGSPASPSIVISYWPGVFSEGYGDGRVGSMLAINCAA